MGFLKDLFKSNKAEIRNNNEKEKLNLSSKKIEHLFIYVDNDPSPVIGLDKTIGVVLSLINAGSIKSDNVALVMDWDVKRDTPDTNVLSKARNHFTEIDWHYAEDRINVVPFHSKKLQMEGKAVVQYMNSDS